MHLFQCSWDSRLRLFPCRLQRRQATSLIEPHGSGKDAGLEHLCTGVVWLADHVNRRRAIGRLPADSDQCGVVEAEFARVMHDASLAAALHARAVGRLRRSLSRFVTGTTRSAINDLGRQLGREIPRRIVSDGN
jgi:hypothetical protein